MSLRIGIITILKANNYGAELQAFALQSKLESMGHESELIDYPFYKHPSYRRCRMAAPLLDIGFVNKVKEAIYPVWQCVKELPQRTLMAARKNRMEDFLKTHTRLSASTYFSMEELYAAEHPYDVFMVGSDQVWNPRLNCSIDPYFLTFSPPGKPRISYASSFGVSQLPAATHQFYADRLAKFDAISVREKQGVDIIRALIGREPAHVLDPTLLLNARDWAAVSKAPEVSGPYVLLYELNRCTATIDLARRVAAHIAGTRVVRLCGAVGGGKFQGVSDVMDAGPSEFVGLFLNATAVITNSYHGTTFALNFQKPFFTVIPDRMKNSGRMISLLEQMGLSDRLMSEGKCASCSIKPEMDFAEAQRRLDQARQVSLDYLTHAVVADGTKKRVD